MSILKCGDFIYRTEKRLTVVLNNSNITLIRLRFLLGTFQQSFRALILYSAVKQLYLWAFCNHLI